MAGKCVAGEQGAGNIGRALRHVLALTTSLSAEIAAELKREKSFAFQQ